MTYYATADVVMIAGRYWLRLFHINGDLARMIGMDAIVEIREAQHDDAMTWVMVGSAYVAEVSMSVASIEACIAKAAA